MEPKDLLPLWFSYNNTDWNNGFVKGFPANKEFQQSIVLDIFSLTIDRVIRAYYR